MNITVIERINASISRITEFVELIKYANSEFRQAYIPFMESNLQGINLHTPEGIDQALEKIATYYNLRCKVIGQVDDEFDTDGIAWVYGSRTPSLQVAPVFYKSALLEYPNYIIIHVLAHECSHLYLFDTNHAYKESERYTDIFAIYRGFALIYGKYYQDLLKNPKSELKVLVLDQINDSANPSEYVTRFERITVVILAWIISIRNTADSIPELEKQGKKLLQQFNQKRNRE